MYQDYPRRHMKMETRIVLFLFAVVAVSYQETATEAATAAHRSVVKGTHDDVITYHLSTNYSATTSITTTHKIPEIPTTTSTPIILTTTTADTPMITTIATTTTRATTHIITELPTTTSTPTTTTTTSLSTTTTTTTRIPSYNACHNGGSYDGFKCICADLYYGPLCESTIDEIAMGRTFYTSVNVMLRITNLEFTEALNNMESEEYRAFLRIFKNEMSSLYSNIPEYVDVEVVSIREGSVIVDHHVIVELDYRSPYAQDYQKIVWKMVENIKSANCTSGDFNHLCFDSEYLAITQLPLPTVTEICNSRVPEGLRDFYDAVIGPDGLSCISHCHTMSPKYWNCNTGICGLSRHIGPYCLCPNTDFYFYTKQHCTGKISKVSLFVGVGVTIGILLIVIVILGIYCARLKNKAPKPLTEEETYYSTIK